MLAGWGKCYLVQNAVSIAYADELPLTCPVFGTTARKMPLDQLADNSRTKNNGLNPRGVDLTRSTNPNGCACKQSTLLFDP